MKSKLNIKGSEEMEMGSRGVKRENKNALMS